MVARHNWTMGVFCWCHHTLFHRTWRSQAGTALEVSFPMASSSSIGRYYVGHQEGNIFNSPIQLQILQTAIRISWARYAQQWNLGTNMSGVFKLCFIAIAGTQEWYCKPSQEPMVEKVIGHRWEPSTIFFKNWSSLLNIYAQSHR